MAKKKVQYPYKTRNNIITGAVLAGLALILVVVVALNISGRHWVMKVDGAKVSERDLKVYMYQQKIMYSYFGDSFWSWQLDENGTTYGQYCSSIALSDLQQREVAKKEAKARGIKLTSDQKKEAKQTLADFKASVSAAALDYIGLSDRKLLKLFEDDMLLKLVYDDMVKDYAFDEADFEEVYAKHLIDDRLTLETHNVNYIVADSADKAAEALEKAKGGENIYDLIKEYSYDYATPEPDEEGNVTDPRMEPASVSNAPYLTDEQKLAIYDLGEGAYSDVYEVEVSAAVTDEETGEETTPALYSYIFVKVTDITYPDYDADRETQKTNYQDDKKYEIFEPIFQTATEAIEFDWNYDMLDTLDIATMPM